MTENLQPGHEQYAEDLALYAVGALEAGSCAQLEQHLKQCPACRHELEAMRGDAALLALAVSGPAPPQRSRQRLLAAIAAGKEAQPESLRAFAVRRPWWSFAPVFASLLLAIFAILLLRENMSLKQTNDQLKRQVSDAENENQKAREIVALITAKDAMHVSLVSAGSPPAPHVKTIYQPSTGRLCLMASNLNPLPAHMTYELWLIPKKGAPMPAGTFKPDAHGMAMMMPENPEVPAWTEVKEFAVTMEPEGGSAAPTSDVLLQGS
ncbi:MAG TPA: anti-sigma factor [Terriglobales bacterium]|jgi:anti-sigma-K factor RskA|nr:anti-sigma factor [Terriglobales bacterium]